MLLGVLPFFHSFGYTVPLWAALTLEPKVVYHYSPLEAKQIGQLCRQHGVTMLIVAPTFLRGYLRRCEPEDFAALEVVIAGAEKAVGEAGRRIRNALRRAAGRRLRHNRAIARRLHQCPARPRAGQDRRTLKEGTVGRPIPGVSAKMVDAETGKIWDSISPACCW